MYVLANRDLELSCDESVIRRFGENTKAAYAQTLIRMEETRSGLTPLCNSFSKNAMEERIIAIMKTKKTSWAAALAAITLVAGVTTAFATTGQTALAANSTEDTETVSLSYVFQPDNDSEDIEWWTAEEYEQWMEEQKQEYQSILGELCWTPTDGWFTWDQERVDGAIASMEQLLEEIQDGKKVSKPTQDGDTMIQFSYDETAVETAAQDDTTAAIDEYTMTAVTDEYTTESGDVDEGFLADMAQYAPFGVIFVQSGDFGDLYWNGELVDILIDQSPVGVYTTIGSEDEGGITIQTVYDSSGKLTGVEAVEPLP
jgi:YD repeat-containing protein